MQIVNLSLDRLFEMEQVFCETLGMSPKGESDATLWGYFDADRSRLAIDDEDQGRRLWALLRDEHNSVAAAAYYSVEEHFDDTGFANRLTVNDLFGINESSQIALWRWLMDLPLVGEVSCDRLDPGSALIHAMEDPRLLITTGMSDTTWLRILDIKRVLGRRASMSTDTVVIQVFDPLIKAARGTWRLVGDGERLRIEPSQDSPEITLDVGLLASLAFAYVTASGLAAAGQLTGQRTALARLDRLLAWPRLAWSSHMF